MLGFQSGPSLGGQSKYRTRVTSWAWLRRATTVFRCHDSRNELSAQPHLGRDERLGVALRRATFRAAHAGQAAKRLRVEPVLAALGRKVRLEQRDLAVHDLARERQVDVGPAHIAVPFGDLVLEDKVIAERGPRQATQLAMVLVRVIVAVG